MIRMIYDKIIEGIKVNLRSAEESDAEYTYRIRQDKEKTKFLHAVNGTVEDQRMWLRNQRAREGDYFFLVTKKDGTPIGTYSVYNVEGTRAEAGRALMYGDPVENLETFVLMHRFIFFILGLEEVYASIITENIASIGLTRQFGGVLVSTEIKEGAEFGLYLTTKEAYLKVRDKHEKLLERFINR